MNAGDLHTATDAHKKLEPLVRAVMTHVPGTVATKYILHGLGRIGSPRVRLPLVGPEEWEAAQIEDEIDLVRDIPGVDFSNFRPDRNAAAGGALPESRAQHASAGANPAREREVTEGSCPEKYTNQPRSSREP